MDIIKKKCKVILLDSNLKKVEKDQLVFGAGKYLFQSRAADDIGSLGAVNLFITINEPIKEGDLRIENNEIFLTPSSSFAAWANQGKHPKIIISTDTELDTIRPSDKFIKMFVEEYNKGNIIKEVEVEYDTTMGTCNKCGAYQYSSYVTCNYHAGCKGKITPIQRVNLDVFNKAIITVVKPTSLIKELCEVNPELKKEIENLLIDCVGQSHDWSRDNNDIHSISIIKERFLNNWIKKNIG